MENMNENKPSEYEIKAEERRMGLLSVPMPRIDNTNPSLPVIYFDSENYQCQCTYNERQK